MIALWLSAAALFPALVSAVMCLLDRRTRFGRLGGAFKQAVIGVLFGGIAVLSTEFGIEVEGAIMNVRDASPLCAGLLFGAPAGIIAGVIGGVHRWLCVLWGGGEYTRLACSVATLLAGLLGAGLRVFMLDNKKPSWFYALLVGLVMEVLHMLMVFVTNMDDVRQAFTVVKICALPMILANGLSVMAATFAVSLIGGEPLRRERYRRQIAQTFQRLLLICVLVAFLCTCLFTFFLQTRLAENDAYELLRLNIEDVRADIAYASETQKVDGVTSNRHIGERGFIIVADASERILSDRREHAGQTLEQAGLALAAESPPGARFEATVYGEPSLCMTGMAEGYQIIAVIPRSEALFSRDISTYIIAFMEIVVFAAMFVNIYFIVLRLVVDNIRRINSSLARITSGDLGLTVDVRASEEFASLSDDINLTVGTLKRYITEAEARIDAELEFARQIQSSALPNVFPPYPNRADFALFASMHPAKEVGGDFYDFCLLGKDTLMLLVADVSGKGIPAALFMMKAKTLIKSLAENGMEPDQVFTKANEELCEGNQVKMFLTAWMGALDLSTGTLTYACAGHNPPLIRRADGAFAYLRGKNDFVLAGISGIPYRRQQIALAPGDTIFLYTDGVTEANDPDGNMLGEERLLNVMNGAGSNEPEALCAHVKAAIDGFARGEPQSDDITMLCVTLTE